ncbi:unnamed protein product [Oikopleura dioica]|uniref:Uncharacterized protein n=1 Tax=Oikopleura dioica TaxID=34765 RepID=E4Z5D2_OIKDI|nr:unnamed protein product [Oikopleura dioica]
MTDTVRQNEDAVQEEQRISLKDRLRNVIESNIRLENRANAGEIAIEIVRKDHAIELNRIKVFYESEMCEARRLLDDQADEFQREQLKNANLKRELEAFKKLNSETEKTLNTTKTALENSEERYDRVNSNLTQKTREAKVLAENLIIFENKNEKLSEKIKILQAQLSSASSELHATSNKLQSAEEIAAMKNQLLENIIALRKNQENDEIERKEIHPSLQPTEELADAFRNEIYEIQKNEFERTAKFENEIEKLKTQIQKLKSEAAANQSKLVIAENKISAIVDENKKEVAQNEEELRKSMIEIEILKDKKADSEKMISERDLEIEKLRKLATSLQESDIKKELTTFESLLKTEEDRLGIVNRKRSSDEIENNEENEKEAKSKKRECAIM